MPRKQPPPPPPVTGGQAYLLTHLTGEIKPQDIPLAANVSQAQLVALTAGDDDPLEVVVEIAPGKGGRGWNYTPAAMQKLVAHVQEKSLGGFLGHQRQEDIEHEFPQPVTHWLGASWDEAGQKAYFRGVVDKTAPDLKRWIRSGRVTQPSIFTYPTLSKGSNGETEVRDLSPLSIDWAPLGRAGMDTARLVYSGTGQEMANTNHAMAWGEMDPPGTPPQQGGPAVPTYQDLIAGLNEGKHDHADLIRDQGITAADFVRVLPLAEISAALGTDGRRALVKGELAEARRAHPRKAAGEQVADPVQALVVNEDRWDKLLERLGLGTDATDEAVFQAIEQRDKALESVVGGAQEATADGVIAEMKLPAPVVPLVRERLVAKLPKTMALLADPKLGSRDAIKVLAGEIVANDPMVKGLVESFYTGGSQVPNGSSGQATGEMSPLSLQQSAGFVFERRSI